MAAVIVTIVQRKNNTFNSAPSEPKFEPRDTIQFYILHLVSIDILHQKSSNIMNNKRAKLLQIDLINLCVQLSISSI